jgi:hypothetical protein
VLGRLRSIGLPNIVSRLFSIGSILIHAVYGYLYIVHTYAHSKAKADEAVFEETAADTESNRLVMMPIKKTMPSLAQSLDNQTCLCGKVQLALCAIAVMLGLLLKVSNKLLASARPYAGVSEGGNDLRLRNLLCSRLALALQG